MVDKGQALEGYAVYERPKLLLPKSVQATQPQVVSLLLDFSSLCMGAGVCDLAAQEVFSYCKGNKDPETMATVERVVCLCYVDSGLEGRAPSMDRVTSVPTKVPRKESSD